MNKIIVIVIIPYIILAQGSNPVRNIFMQGNNINTSFSTDGIFNYDRTIPPYGEAGLIWPASLTNRKTIAYTSGIWIFAIVGPQAEIRAAACAYSSHFTPGNIPLVGQITPQSVCNDSTWRGYFVQLTDPSLVNGGVRTKTAGGRSYIFNYDAWANWPVQKGAPYVEVNNITGYQPGWNSDRPGIGNGSHARPDELMFMVYMDYTNCSNNRHFAFIDSPGGTLPLGVEIHQLSFMFNCISLRNNYFQKWIFINKSQYNWDSTYFTLFNDFDIGAGPCGASDDSFGCDTTRNLCYMYNGDNNDCNYGINPPSIGTRYLQSPLKYTGNQNDTAKLPYGNFIGFKIVGLTSCFNWTGNDICKKDPDEYLAGFNFVKGLDGCGHPFINPITGLPTKFVLSGNACNRTGWVDSFTHDTRFIQSSGPFTMNSRDTQIVVVSYSISSDGGNNFQNVCAVQSLSDTALKYYYNDFQTCIPIGIQPISNEVPEKFALYQNYPNPFNPVTKIKFAIPPAVGQYIEHVQLKVYDILGREIVNLINEELKPGIYEVEWNAENYPSGVYFYTVTAGKYFDSKKMILLK